MSSIEQIPVRVSVGADALTGQAEAILTEIAEMLRQFLEQGREDSIDLRSLPLSPADRTWLDEQLGRGEAEIVLQAGGRSVLMETAYPAVWKVTHFDTRDQVVAELIEIALVPVILKPDLHEVKRGYERLSLVSRGKLEGA